MNSSSVARPSAPSAAMLNGISDAFDLIVDRICMVFFAVMVFAVLLQVICRYVLSIGLPWPEELARLLFVWMVFLGLGSQMRRLGLMRIDMFLGMMPVGLRNWFELVIHTLNVTTCLAMVIHGWEMANRSTAFFSSFPLAFKYEYMAVPVGALIALYYLLRQSFNRWSSPLIGLAGFVAGIGLYWFLLGQADTLLDVVGEPSTILLVSVLLFLLIGQPVALAMALSSFLAFWPRGPLVTLAVTQNMVSSADSFVLLAIPFFILAAALMNDGGITQVLVDLADTLVGHVRGGLGHVNVLTNTLMAGLSGSSAADAAGICKALVPSMKKAGYDPAFSAALTSAASILASVIPPSIGMLIYAALASASVGALFVAGIVPGLMLAASLMVIVYIQSRRKGYGANRPRASLGEIGRALRKSIWALGLALIIVLGIRFGVFTPTEAASVAAIYALLTGLLIYRGLGLRSILHNSQQSILETANIVFIMAASGSFAWLLVAEQVPQQLAAQLGPLASNPILLMLAVNALLLLIGLPLEMPAALPILVPILLPIISAAGIDPVYFGIVMIINLMIGSLTPPVGVMVFIAAGISEVPAHRVFWHVIPFEIALIVTLLIVTYVPATSLMLPQILSGR